MNNNFMDRVNAIMQQNQMSQNMMAAPQPQPSYPDAGIGELDNVVSGVPRQAELMNQPHMVGFLTLYPKFPAAEERLQRHTTVMSTMIGTLIHTKNTQAIIMAAAVMIIIGLLIPLLFQRFMYPLRL